MQVFNENLMKFIDASPTAFQTVNNLKEILLANDFSELFETEAWSLQADGKYFVIRNNSSLIAFTLSGGEFQTAGFSIAGTHTDSPALKVKPQPDMQRHNCYSVAVEPYGGAIWTTWFDRELSLAGRVCWVDENETLQSGLVDFRKPLAIIPSLAIHLDRTANDGKTINKQTDLPPLMMLTEDKEVSFNDMLIKELQQQGAEATEIMDYELFFYPCQPSQYCGYNNDFIASPRLDNLLSCYAATKALIQDTTVGNCMVVHNDHEECGSNSTSGAAGTLLQDVLKRITNGGENYRITVARSQFISADNAHAVHPNFTAKHEPGHLPMLNKGPVIKINANQRYATDAENSAQIRLMARKNDIPMQTFVARSDAGCGSTIGPVTASRIGISTLDIGAPTYAMHSARELTGSQDPWMLFRILKHFFC